MSQPGGTRDPFTERIGAPKASRSLVEIRYMFAAYCCSQTCLRRISLRSEVFSATQARFVPKFHLMTGRHMQYDRIDARILEIVQKNNRLTSEVIGEMAGLSASACQRRLKALRSQGIIEADISIVSPKEVGRPIQMLVLATLERDRSDIVDRFKRAIKSSVEVANGFYVTGEADFLLYVTARTMEDYEQFTRKFFHENPDVKGFKTMVVLDRVKAGFAVPVEIPPEV